MKAIDWVHSLAGIFIVIGVFLTIQVNFWWILLPGFVGLNLLQFGFTKFCPMVLILKRLGISE
jgi:hypothetical protein